MINSLCTAGLWRLTILKSAISVRRICRAFKPGLLPALCVCSLCKGAKSSEAAAQNTQPRPQNEQWRNQNLPKGSRNDSTKTTYKFSALILYPKFVCHSLLKQIQKCSISRFGNKSLHWFINRGQISSSEENGLHLHRSESSQSLL